MVSELSDEKSIHAILVFWFEEISPETWFKKDHYLMTCLRKNLVE